MNKDLGKVFYFSQCNWCIRAKTMRTLNILFNQNDSNKKKRKEERIIKKNKQTHTYAHIKENWKITVHTSLDAIQLQREKSWCLVTSICSVHNN